MAKKHSSLKAFTELLEKYSLTVIEPMKIGKSKEDYALYFRDIIKFNNPWTSNKYVTGDMGRYQDLEILNCNI